MSRPVSAWRVPVLATAIAALWAVVAAIVHSTVVLPLSVSLLDRLAPPAWWFNSRLPWPVSLLDAAIFALVAAAFLWGCTALGVSRSQALVGVLAGLALIWVWVAGQALFATWALGATDAWALVRSGAPVNVSGSVGAAIGALLASGVLSGLGSRAPGSGVPVSA